MNRPNMLITGTSRGIGLACAEHFSDRYNIIGISRSTGTYVTEIGSVTDLQFRKYLINKYTPDVFINNAGVGIDVPTDVIFQTNAEAAGDFMVGFAEKMNSGHIINISSWLATITYNPWAGYRESVYQVTKKLITGLSKELNAKQNGHVKITNIEPENIDTDMVRKYLKSNIKPMSTAYIAETIDWIINQPSWVNIDSICISNFRDTGAPGRTRTDTH